MNNDLILYIVRGIPGSGKGEIAKALAPDNHYSATDFFYDKTGKFTYDVTRLENVHKKCYKAVQQDMYSGVPVIAVANTFVHKWEYEAYVDTATKLGYSIREIICRGDAVVSQYEVPSEKIKKMLDEFEY